MAVRRQLQRFFEEPQVRGTIVVERPLSSEPPPAPPPTSEVPRCYELRPEDCAVFQCRGCWAVLGDSLHLCALEEQRLGLLVCLRVTSNVLCEEALMVGLEGALMGCAYNTLSCQSCGSVVGFVLYSAFRDLAHLRGFFCFFKNSIFWSAIDGHDYRITESLELEGTFTGHLIIWSNSPTMNRDTYSQSRVLRARSTLTSSVLGDRAPTSALDNLCQRLTS